LDAKKPQAAETPKYPIGELIAQSKAIFGVNREVIIGAVHGIDVTGNEFTVDEVKAHIEVFLKRKVK